MHIFIGNSFKTTQILRFLMHFSIQILDDQREDRGHIKLLGELQQRRCRVLNYRSSAHPPITTITRPEYRSRSAKGLYWHSFECFYFFFLSIFGVVLPELKLFFLAEVFNDSSHFSTSKSVLVNSCGVFFTGLFFFKTIIILSLLTE